MADQGRERLAAIRVRCDKAMSGPWCAENVGEKENVYIVGVAFSNSDLDAEHPLSGWPRFHDSEGNDIAIRIDQVCDVGDQDDANFIVHARTDVPYLLSLVEALLPVVEAAKPFVAPSWDRTTSAWEGARHNLRAALSEAQRVLGGKP